VSTALAQGVTFPPGYEQYTEVMLRQFRHPLWREPRWTAEGAHYRRWLTRGIRCGSCSPTWAPT
jgi:hypothetical protein